MNPAFLSRKGTKNTKKSFVNFVPLWEKNMRNCFAIKFFFALLPNVK